MVLRLSNLFAFGCVMLAAVHCASISDNQVYETPRIHTGDELISSIMSDCFVQNTMSCLKGKVLTYLDTVLELREEQSRNFESDNIDKVIFERVARLLEKNEIKVQLPETLFQSAVVIYNRNSGLDIEVPEESVQQARGDLLKKKLLLPILLLLKLKMKALMPIIVAIVGLKAMKALILSKLAITLVLGFIIFNLVKKTGMPMPMSMAPMMPAEPMPYGPPAPAPSTPSSYDPAAWEPSNGGPYSRVWEPSSANSAQNMAYNAYYPGSSSTNPSSSSGSSSSSAHTY